MQVSAQEYHLVKTLDRNADITCFVQADLTGEIIAGDGNGTLSFFDPATGNLLREIHAHDHAVRQLAFNSTGKLLMSVSSVEIKIWDLESGNLLHRLANQNADIRFALFSIADGFIYFCSSTRLYKTRSDLALVPQILYDFTDPVYAGAIPIDRSVLILATGNNIRLIDTRSDNITQDIRVSDSPILQMSLMPGNRIAAWCQDGTVSIRSLNLGMLEVSPSIAFKAGNSSPMAFSGDGCRMLSGNIGYWARIWNWQNRSVEQELFGHKGNVQAFLFSKGDDRIFTGSNDRTIKIWSRKKDEQPVTAMPAEPPLPKPQPVVSPANPVVLDNVNLPVAISGRPVSQAENIEVGNDELEIFVYDNLVIDGDTMSLNFNGEWLLKNYGVEREKKRLVLHFKKGNNSLVLYAENLGKSPPNTAAVEFEMGGRKHIIRLKSDLKTCSALNFVLK
jgi:hypothetical protein